MTVSAPPPSNVAKDAQAARKRRRRATAGGAADDCFTCIKRNIKCDRRRPYCSQCLEKGSDCSGYKTQLTWGVGVASRGKLRGLSLPIAKAPPVAPVMKKSATRARANSAITLSHWHSTEDTMRRHQRDSVDVSIHHGASVPSTTYETYPDYRRFSHVEPPVTVSHTAWGGLSAYAGHIGAHEHSNFHKVNSSLSHYAVMTEPVSSADSLSETDYTLSPIGHSFPREEVPFMHSPPLILSSHHDSYEPHMVPRLVSDSDTMSVPEMESYSVSPRSTVPPFWVPSNTRGDDVHSHHGMKSNSSLPHLSYGSHSLQVSPDLIKNMSFFIDYYENVMCSSLVLIDGPNNPYRDHILRLASSSRSLQHAICALSACNLRMKRRLSLGHYTRNSPLAATENGSPDYFSNAYPDDRSLSEEHEHRNLAIHLLNSQLNDISKACHDSVLATILLLCHYRMVESGVAKFQTQFAGVKKILSIRNSVDLQPSRQSAWMEGVFTYFDSISASINERESQLTNSFFERSTESLLLPPGAENLVGCDRMLFQTIHKLGRLNLLSQNRPVRSAIDSPSDPCEAPVFSPVCSPTTRSLEQKSEDFFSPAQSYDGNGFVTKYDSDILSSGFGLPIYGESRSIFWQEWKEARMALQTWEFDVQRIATSLPNPPSPTQLRDLNYLSEAFRYAALLYIERLASPNAPSNNNNSRNLVSQVIYYATSLSTNGSAEKFLLWPLFIAGSECVNELQQNIVRNKCRDIMSRSGYMNNMAAMDVLERLWSNDDIRIPGSKLGFRSGPFNWTKCIGGPGVDVEWIMF